MHTQSVLLCVPNKIDSTIVVFWFVEVDSPDDGGDCHWNMLECSLTV